MRSNSEEPRYSGIQCSDSSGAGRDEPGGGTAESLGSGESQIAGKGLGGQRSQMRWWRSATSHILSPLLCPGNRVESGSRDSREGTRHGTRGGFRSGVRMSGPSPPGLRAGQVSSPSFLGLSSRCRQNNLSTTNASASSCSPTCSVGLACAVPTFPNVLPATSRPSPPSNSTGLGTDRRRTLQNPALGPKTVPILPGHHLDHFPHTQSAVPKQNT